MIDLHSHILPGLDDGADTLATSLKMARAYVGQDIQCVACTPHILPGLYHNTGPKIRAETARLQAHFDEEGVPLRLVPGADNHIAPDFVNLLRSGDLLALSDSRYVLVEPPHHVAPVQLEALFFEILTAEYVPVLTHPERLSWIESHYTRIQGLAERGVWMQITSGSLLGRFGRRAKYWAERLLSENLVHILATDAHDVSRRPPDLLEGRMAVEKRAGAQKAEDLTVIHPMIVLSNKAPSSCILGKSDGAGGRRRGNERYVKIDNGQPGGSLVSRLRQFF